MTMSAGMPAGPESANQVTATNLRLSQTEARLKAQFAAMETAMQTAQSQQAWLAGQIASLG